MISNFRNMIWLCWILSGILSLADCEPNGNGAGSGSGSEGKGFLAFLRGGGHTSFDKYGASNPYKFGHVSCTYYSIVE
jgi:hypothetical protein